MKRTILLLILLVLVSWTNADVVFTANFEDDEINPGGADTIAVPNTTPYPATQAETISDGEYGWAVKSYLIGGSVTNAVIFDTQNYVGENAVALRDARFRTDILHTIQPNTVYSLTVRYMLTEGLDGNDDKQFDLQMILKDVSYNGMYVETPFTISVPEYGVWYTRTVTWDSTGYAHAGSLVQLRIGVTCGDGTYDDPNDFAAGGGAYIDSIIVSTKSYIPTVTATASSSLRSELGPVYTVNWGGLGSGSARSHSDGTDYTAWLSQTGVVDDQYLIYDLGGYYDVDEVRVWNYNQSGVTGRGIQDVNLMVSSDGSTYTTVGSTRTFTQATGSTTTDYSEVFALNSNAVRYVKFDIINNWGYGSPTSTQVGLAEAEFYGDFLYTPYRLWTNSLADQNWNDANNWADFFAGNSFSFAPYSVDYGIPVAPKDIVQITSTGTDSPVIDSSVPGISQLYVGQWYQDTAGPAGELTIETGGSLNITGALYLGRWGSSQGPSHLQIDGGYLFANYLEQSWLGSGSDIDIDGGTLELGSGGWYAGGNINITNGTLIVAGDQTGNIDGWKSANVLTAFDGRAGNEIHYDYNTTNPGKTTIWASLDGDYAWNPSVMISGDSSATAPSDGLHFSWNAGDSAVTHNLYFGYTYDDVNDATTSDPECVATGLTDTFANTRDFGFYPGFSTTFYWRVDEVGSSSTKTGVVWSFTLGYPGTWVDHFDDHNDTNDLATWWTASGGATIDLDSDYGYGSQSLKMDFDNTTGGYTSEATVDFNDPNVWGRTQDLTMANQSAMDINFRMASYLRVAEVINTIGGCEDAFPWTGWTKETGDDWTVQSSVVSGNPCGNNHWLDYLANALLASNYRSPEFTISGDVIRVFVCATGATNGGSSAGSPYGLYNSNIKIELTADVNVADDYTDDQVLETRYPRVNGATAFELIPIDVRSYVGRTVYIRIIDGAATAGIALAMVDEAELIPMYAKFTDNAEPNQIAVVDYDTNGDHPAKAGSKLLNLPMFPETAIVDYWVWWPISQDDILDENANIDLTDIRTLTLGLGDGSVGTSGTMYFDELTSKISRCESGWGSMPMDISPTPLDNDCWVNIYDLEEMSENWLSSYDMSDMAALAADWLENDMWPVWTGLLQP